MKPTNLSSGRGFGRQLLVEQGTDGQAAGLPLRQQGHEPLQRLARINNILDQEDMFALQAGLRVVQQPDPPAGDLPVPVGARHQEVHLDRPLDGPDQIAQEDEAALEQPQNEELAVGVRLR